MRNHRDIMPLPALALALLLATVPACGKKSTGPGGGVVTVKELDSGSIPGAQQYQHTFSTAGSFHYCCDIHGCGQMSGDVTVANGNPAAAAVSITNFAFTPANALVAPGGTVTWTNNGSAHTVTSH